MSNISNLTSKPMADIEETLNDSSGRNFDTVNPVYLKKLEGKMKAAEIADLIGYSPGGISGILNGDTKCRRVVELAAQLIYQERFERKTENKNVCAFISGELALMKTIQSMMSIGAGNFIFVEVPK